MSKPLQPVISARAQLSILRHGEGLGTEFLHYETQGGRAHMECRFLNPLLWRSHMLIVEPLQNSSSHVKNVLAKRLTNKKECM